MTKVTHPNVWARPDADFGKICVDILDDRWTPACKLSQILISIQQLLETPNADDALDPQVSKSFFPLIPPPDFFLFIFSILILIPRML